MASVLSIFVFFLVLLTFQQGLSQDDEVEDRETWTRNIPKLVYALGRYYDKHPTANPKSPKLFKAQYPKEPWKLFEQACDYSKWKNFVYKFVVDGLNPLEYFTPLKSLSTAQLAEICLTQWDSYPTLMCKDGENICKCLNVTELITKGDPAKNESDIYTFHSSNTPFFYTVNEDKTSKSKCLAMEASVCNPKSDIECYQEDHYHCNPYSQGKLLRNILYSHVVTLCNC